MDFRLPPDDDPLRLDLRAWLAAHPDPSGRDLAEAGLVAPHWPAPWGRGAGPTEQIVVEQELAHAGVERPDNPIGIGWAGPTIVHAGTPEQQQRWLPGLLSGDEFWCQLFSEPDAGSDLASLRCKAVLDGDDWVVTGSKCWNTWSERAQWGILLVRTDPDAPKHRGISYLICPMDAPGITIRVLTEMTGGHHFCEVHFDEVRIPADHLIGAPHEGWRLAVVTLANERVSLSEGGLLWGDGPDTDDFLATVRANGPVRDPRLRQRVAEAWGRDQVLHYLGYRILTARLQGDERVMGQLASIRKTLADEHGQRVCRLAKDLRGAAGMLGEQSPANKTDDPWHWGFLFSAALTIGGGTSEVQRNILSERVLGLPQEQRPAVG